MNVTVIVVSNRVARAKPDEPVAGGLAAALLPAVKSYGAIWVGASGRLIEPTGRDAFAEIEAFGKGALATVDLPQSDYQGFYEGYANSALWPTMHSRSDLIRATVDDYRSYRTINAYMARALLRFSAPDVCYWIHDYHFLTLGEELRKLGVELPLGFFLHTPWPAPCAFAAMPNHREIAEAMLAFNLIGFQTDQDRNNFSDYIRTEFHVAIVDDQFITPHGTCRLGTFPIGIDVEDFARRAAKAAAGPSVARLRSSLQGGALAIGADRVDYSKGLANRLRAFDRMLTMHPEQKGEISYLQIAVPSRGTIPVYCALQAELASIVGEVNGRHGEVDWTPIRYLNKGYSQATLAGLYRMARLGLVTPLQDGMNLVAKEYVAAQNPFDPGVLVLSTYAGAARELKSALLVNPNDVDGMAKTFARGLQMSLDERTERWEAMMKALRKHSVHSWFADFVGVLSTSESVAPVPSRGLVRLHNRAVFH